MELGGWESVGDYYGCICDEGLVEYIERTWLYWLPRIDTRYLNANNST